jgi:hypothetical protein
MGILEDPIFYIDTEDCDHESSVLSNESSKDPHSTFPTHSIGATQFQDWIP